MKNIRYAVAAGTALFVVSATAGAQLTRTAIPRTTTTSASVPAGMCRIWIDGLPASRQPAPTDCNTARARVPSNGRVIYGSNTQRPVYGSTGTYDPRRDSRSGQYDPRLDRTSSRYDRRYDDDYSRKAAKAREQYLRKQQHDREQYERKLQKEREKEWKKAHKQDGRGHGDDHHDGDHHDGDYHDGDHHDGHYGQAGNGRDWHR